jgi:hypothetical protein
MRIDLKENVNDVYNDTIYTNLLTLVIDQSGVKHLVARTTDNTEMHSCVWSIVSDKDFEELLKMRAIVNGDYNSASHPEPIPEKQQQQTGVSEGLFLKAIAVTQNPELIKDL